MSLESSEQFLIYEKEAKKGSADAQFALGRMYEAEAKEIDTQYYLDAATQKVMFQTYKKALTWYKKAAKQGHADAQNNLGAMYLTGNGVSRDIDIAIQWYIKSSSQGNLNAQSMLPKVQELRRSSKRRGLIGWLFTILFLSSGG